MACRCIASSFRCGHLFAFDNVVPHRGASKVDVKVCVCIFHASEAISGDLRGVARMLAR
jgi:hypothetical protein